MGKNLQKLYSFRTDEEIINKMSDIAKKHSRTRNKEIEYALKLYIEQYEKEHGRVKTDTELSVSKIG